MKTFQGRRKPTASKINFLLHLDDHRQESSIGIRDASCLLEEISIWIDANPDKLDVEYGLAKKLQSWCDDIRQELKHLQAALLEIKDPLVNVQIMVSSNNILLKEPMCIRLMSHLDKRSDRPSTAQPHSNSYLSCCDLSTILTHIRKYTFIIQGRM